MRRGINVFWTLWLSYISILAIPVVIAAVLFANIKDEMVENASRSNLAMLEQAKQVVNTSMLEIDQLMMQISTHPKLQILWNLDDGERYVEHSEAVSLLRNLNNGNRFISDFYVYYANRDVVISPSIKTDSTMFFTRLAPYGDYTPAELRQKLLTGYQFKTFFPSETVYYYNEPSRNVIATTASLPLGDKDHIKATLVMLIDEQRIHDLLQQIQWANSAFMYIRDGNGQLLMSTTGVLEQPPDLQTGEAPSGFRPYQLNDEEMLLSYTKGMNGWEYISLMPSKVVLEPIVKMTRIAVILLIIAVLAGAAVAYWLANRNYGPVRDVVAALLDGGDRRGTRVRMRNEYDFIKWSISQQLEERNQMRSTLADYTQVVRAHFLTRLLKGQAEDELQDPASLHAIGVSLPYQQHGVVLIEIEDSSSFRNDDSDRELALVRFVLYNVSSELLAGKGYMVETERNQLAWLLNPSDSVQEAEGLREQLIEDLKQVVERRFRLTLLIGISCFHAGPNDFSRAYSEALSALDYRIIHGGLSVIHYDQINKDEHAYYHYPIETEIRLINHLKAGDSEHAGLLLDELYEHNVASGEMTSEMGKYLLVDVASTIMKVMSSLKVSGKDLMDGQDPIRLMMDQPTLKEMLTVAQTICGLICERVRSARSVQGESLNEQIKAFIDHSLLDHGLSLTAIADHFDMAPQYISGFFKKHNHQNLTDYIALKRMEAAKGMLMDTSMTMTQIAQRIGYANDIGFIRVFKKHEGITPGKYREMERNET